MQRTDDFPFHLIPAPLLAWYRAHKRALPWRENPTPYRVWVSEIMLQQTRVEAAREYYLRFLAALPDVAVLAACAEDKLLKLWEGLGYYSRARNMQKTARLLLGKYGGEFPRDEKALKALPGIGDYTAGAVLSIACGLPVPAVDGNVLRVLSRLCENPTDISQPAYRAYLAEKLRAVYPPDAAGCSDFTQSLMELGALVCTPRSPACADCPLKGLCRAAAHGTQGKYPVLPAKKEKRREEVFVFVLETPRGIAVRRRESGVLKGMDEFPSHVVRGRETPGEVLAGWGVSGFAFVRSKRYTHVFTHLHWEITCFYARADSVPFPVFSREELEREVSLPTAFRQCAEILFLLA